MRKKTNNLNSYRSKPRFHLYQNKPTHNLTNIAGLSSLILFAALGYVALTPRLMDEAVAADYCKGDNGYVVCDATATVDTYAHVASVVSLGVQSNVVMDVVPKSTGVVTETPVSLRVSTNSPEGYSLYMKTLGSTNALTSINDDHSEISPIDGQVAFSSLSSQDNVWGYAIGSGNNTEKIYQAVPTTQEQAIYATDHLVVDGGDDVVDLSFASNITTSLPAGTYSNSVLISAVANPVTITNLSELVFMQDMTHDICANTADYVDLDHYVTKQLIDTRDGNKYWVSKLADGNCWMVQNLGLVFGEGAGQVSRLTSMDSDLNSKSEWVLDPNLSTGEIVETNPNNRMRKTEFTVPTKATSVVQMNTRSWNFGEVVMATPTAGKMAACSIYSDFIADCPTFNLVDVSNSDNFTASYTAAIGDWDGAGKVNDALLAVKCTEWNNTTCIAGEYDSHYTVGGYYEYNAAMAGSGNSTSPAYSIAPDSICPKGWMIPTSLEISDKSFRNLMTTFFTSFDENNVASDNTSQIIASPTHFILAGEMWPGSSNATVDISTASQGWYWSSQKGDKVGMFGRLVISLNSLRAPYFDNNPQPGLSVRCLAR